MWKILEVSTEDTINQSLNNDCQLKKIHSTTTTGDMCEYSMPNREYTFNYDNLDDVKINKTDCRYSNNYPLELKKWLSQERQSISCYSISDNINQSNEHISFAKETQICIHRNNDVELGRTIIHPSSSSSILNNGKTLKFIPTATTLITTKWFSKSESCVNRRNFNIKLEKNKSYSFDVLSNLISHVSHKNLFVNKKNHIVDSIGGTLERKYQQVCS